MTKTGVKNVNVMKSLFSRTGLPFCFVFWICVTCLLRSIVGFSFLKQKVVHCVLRFWLVCVMIRGYTNTYCVTIISQCQWVYGQKYSKTSFFFWIFLCKNSSLTKTTDPCSFLLKMCLIVVKVSLNHWVIPEKIQTGEVKDILFGKPPGSFHFFILPLEIPDKTKLNPWILHKIVLDPLEIPSPKQRTL